MMHRPATLWFARCDERRYPIWSRVAAIRRSLRPCAANGATMDHRSGGARRIFNKRRVSVRSRGDLRNELQVTDLH
jgi:hypothetical protein